MLYLTLVLSLGFAALMSILKWGFGCSEGVLAVVKIAASIFFVLTGFISVNRSKEKWNKFSRLMFCGLILGMAGDAALGFDYLGLPFFITGFLLFVSGHVFYFIGFCNKSKISPKGFIPGTVLSIAFISFLVIKSDKFDYGGLFPVVIIYGLIVLNIVGKAFAFVKDFKNDKRTVLLIIIGVSVFAISDFLLLLRLFYKLEPSHVIYIDNANLLLYYIGQNLIALSLSKQLSQK